MPIRVLIADDHEVVRSGLRSLLAGSDIEVVDEAMTGADAVAKTREHRPQVVLMDIRMPDSDGLTALEEIHNEIPESRVIVLSTFDNPTYIARAVALGADEYLLKGMERQEIIEAIHAVATGAPSRGSSLLRQVAGTMGARAVAEDPEVALTQRETQVLRHLALGLSNKEIGRSMTISIETVKEHVQNVLRKINCADRTQAAVWAVRRQLV